MVEPLNHFGIDVAMLGNHDLDCEYSHALKLKNMTNCTWLMSNVKHKLTQ
jgi:2',3'-cyclic-nucleotide 2'-phosphodiesterase (5'-nucleotidase family)